MKILTTHYDYTPETNNLQEEVATQDNKKSHMKGNSLNNKLERINSACLTASYLYSLFANAFFESDDFTCPCCEAKAEVRTEIFTIHGYYNREVTIGSMRFLGTDITLNDDETIEVTRLKCKNCGCTHSLLPSFMAPFKKHVHSLALNALSAHYKKNNNDKSSLLFTKDQLDNLVACFEGQLSRIISVLGLDFFDVKEDKNNSKKLDIIEKIQEYGLTNFIIAFAKENARLFLCSRNLYYLHKPRTSKRKFFPCKVTLYYMEVTLF